MQPQWFSSQCCGHVFLIIWTHSQLLCPLLPKTNTWNWLWEQSSQLPRSKLWESCKVTSELHNLSESMLRPCCHWTDRTMWSYWGCDQELRQIQCLPKSTSNRGTSPQPVTGHHRDLLQKNLNSSPDSRRTSNKTSCLLVSTERGPITGQNTLESTRRKTPLLPRLVFKPSHEPAMDTPLQWRPTESISGIWESYHASDALQPDRLGIQYVPQPGKQRQDPQLPPGTSLHRKGPWWKVELHLGAQTRTIGNWRKLLTQRMPEAKYSNSWVQLTGPNMILMSVTFSICKLKVNLQEWKKTNLICSNLRLI